MIRKNIKESVYVLGIAAVLGSGGLYMAYQRGVSECYRQTLPVMKRQREIITAQHDVIVGLDGTVHTYQQLLDCELTEGEAQEHMDDLAQNVSHALERVRQARGRQ